MSGESTEKYLAQIDEEFEQFRQAYQHEVDDLKLANELQQQEQLPSRVTPD